MAKLAEGQQLQALVLEEVQAQMWAMATAQGFKGTLPGSKRRITTEEVILVAVDMMASAEIVFTAGIFSPMLQEAQVGLWREKC